MALFEDRKVSKSSKSSYMNTGREDKPKGKSGVYYTSQMQGIIATKEENEKKAAQLLSDYLLNCAETTYDERVLLSNMEKMLTGFTVEEKFRITATALVQALCKIA